MKYKVELIDKILYVYINDLLHLRLKFKNSMILQSWKMSDSWYRIQFVNKKGKILTYCEYDSYKKFSSILKLLQQKIKTN